MLDTMGQAKCLVQKLPGSGKTLTQPLIARGGWGLYLQTEGGSMASLALGAG